MANVEWRCTFAVFRHFLQCLSLLGGMEPGKDDYQAVVEEIRGLPSYPNNYDEDRDVIVPVPYREYLLS